MNLTPKAQRYLKVMAVAVAIDLLGYILAHFTHAPAWIDANGTAYAAMMLEPAAGLLVAFIVSFFKAAFIYTSSDLMAYALSAATALIFGIGMRRQGRITMGRLLPMAGLFVVVNTVLGVGLAYWQGGLISGWEQTFAAMALGWGLPGLLSTTFGVFVLKVVDGAIMVVVLFIAYHLTPTDWINQETHSLVSWSEPFFTKKN